MLPRVKAWKVAGRVVVAAALTALLLVVWLRGMDLSAVARQVGDARPVWVAACSGLAVVHVLLRARRWRVLLEVSDGGSGEAPPRPPFGELVSAIVLGYAATFIVPGRLGEVMRPALLWLRTGYPAGRALASVVLERLLDLATVLTLLLAFVLVEPDRATPALTRTAVLLFAVAAAGGAALVVLHRTRGDMAGRLVDAVARRVPSRLGSKVASLGHGFLRGFDALHAPGAWWRLPAWSLLVWGSIVAGLQCAILATGAEAPASAGLVLVPLSAAGIAVPTPAGVGGYHAAFTYGMTAFLGTGAERAAATAVVAHAASVLPMIAWGVVLFWRMGLSLSGLAGALRGVRERPESGQAGARPEVAS
jgi:hypothetical protein